ncbi:MAG: hypothetical protein KAI43_08050 [Candidatus Aureabacteria bacterium]|nr:hypothetical protein [Candidatus Auribacterota bacterium]
MSDKKNLVGISWFRPEQWDTLRKISSEYGGFKETYEEWERSAASHYKKLKKLGFNVQKKYIDASKLHKWYEDSKTLIDNIHKEHAS